MCDCGRRSLYCIKISKQTSNDGDKVIIVCLLHVQFLFVVKVRFKIIQIACIAVLSIHLEPIVLKY